LVLFEDHMPAKRFDSVDTHVGGFIHHGGNQFVYLVIFEEDEEDSCDVGNVFVVEHFSFLFLEEKQQLA